MKINKIVAAAMSAALIFSACTKDNGANGPESQPTSKATINVKFDLDGSKVRAIDNISGDQQDYVKIEEACIFLIEGGDGTVAASRYINNVTNLSTTGALFENVSTAVSEVFVVTNAGDITLLMANKSQIHATLKSLGDLEAAYNGSKIWSYGSVSIASDDWVVTEDDSVEGVVTYTSRADVSITEVNPILSRVDFTVKADTATKWIDASGTVPTTESYVILHGAALLYSAAYTHYIPVFTPSVAALGSNDALVSGILPAEGTEWYNSPRAESAQYATAGAESFLHATWTGSWSGTANVSAKIFSRSFYALAPNDVYAGASVAAKPIIVVYGERYIYESGAYEEPEMIFWPIHFDGESKYGAAAKTLTMENGMRYAITVTLTGDLSDPDKHEITTPEKRYPADVNVTVSEAEWKGVIEVEQTFGE